MKAVKNRLPASMENDTADRKFADVASKFTWAETFLEMARTKESWEDFETVVSDGLEE